MGELYPKHDNVLFALLQHFRYYNCLEIEILNTDYLENRKV